MKLRVIITNHWQEWQIYCPMWGDFLKRGFKSETEARDAAESFGLKVVDEGEIEDVERVEINGYDHTALRWFIANSDMSAITKGYADLLLYEARIKRCERDGNDSLKYTYEGLSVATSVMLERIASDFNGRYFPSHMWTNLAKWENEQAKLRGETRVVTAAGTCELV